MIKVSDLVCTLDDDFEGIVVAVNDTEISVKDIDGFVLQFRESELIPQISPSIKKELSRVPNDVVAKKTPKQKLVNPKVKSKERNRYALEVDLHIHNLTDRTKGMLNYEMLNLQIDTARRQLDFAINKRIQKIVFIHGVGEGVLREELYTLFRRYDNIKYYDANFQKYGLGATEVYIYQNAKS